MNNQALLVLVLVVEGVILISVCTLFYQLLRQQGRILLRLDNLEQSATSGLAAQAGHAELHALALKKARQNGFAPPAPAHPEDRRLITAATCSMIWRVWEWAGSNKPQAAANSASVTGECHASVARSIASPCCGNRPCRMSI